MSGEWKSVPGAAHETQPVRRHAVGVESTVEVQQPSVAVRYLVARLRGTEAGDPNGTGHANFRLNRLRARACANVTYNYIGTPNAAHIHRKSDSGVVVDLTGSVTDGAIQGTLHR